MNNHWYSTPLCITIRIHIILIFLLIIGIYLIVELNQIQFLSPPCLPRSLVSISSIHYNVIVCWCLVADLVFVLVVMVAFIAGLVFSTMCQKFSNTKYTNHSSLLLLLPTVPYIAIDTPKWANLLLY